MTPLPQHIDTLPEEPVDLAGPYGLAWQVRLDALRRTAGTVQPDAALGSWVIYAPAAHPFWHSYALHLIHLRPLPNQRAPVIYRSWEAPTHELFLYALSPEQGRYRLDAPAPTLIPINFAAQFTALDDQAAIDRITATVVDILKGNLSPDTDARRHWMTRFGSSNYPSPAVSAASGSTH